MKLTIENLKDSFKVGYEAFEASRNESNTVWDLYHNRHYTPDQIAVLLNRKQPAETFNIVKMFARMLVGYYSTVVNEVQVMPAHPRDQITASALNDVVRYVFKDNRFDIEGDQIKLGGLLSGLMCAYVNVEDSGEKDEFNRPIYRTVINHVPDSEIILDPSSSLDDYSDAQWLHRFKWMTRERVTQLFGKDAVKEMASYDNYLSIPEADFEFNYGTSFTGYYRVFDNFLVVHTVMTDDEGKRWSVFWSGDKILLKEEITYKDARWPYRVQKLHSSNKAEYYGIFREVIESQHAINQAVLTVQLMINSEKVLVQDGAVANIEDFTRRYNRVNAIVPVLNINGIKIEQMAREVQEQYIIIDNALNRIQKVLGINDSFLGMAYAADSGRKVKLQQNQTVMSLRYVTTRIESFYRSLGEDVAHLVRQFYRAHQVLALTDDVVGQRWIEINKPMEQWSGEIDPMTGEPIMEPIVLPETDPATGKLIQDEDGRIIMTPITEEETDIAFTKFQVNIESTAYNDEDEKGQLFLESVMSGQIGQMMAQTNPQGFFQIAALAMRSMKTKYSPSIVDILEQTAQMMTQGQNQQQGQMAAQNLSQGPMSSQLKLPQNTNEDML